MQQDNSEVWPEEPACSPEELAQVRAAVVELARRVSLASLLVQQLRGQNEDLKAANAELRSQLVKAGEELMRRPPGLSGAAGDASTSIEPSEPAAPAVEASAPSELGDEEAE